jgi:hypothetical protein
MLEDALAAAAQERDAVAREHSRRSALLRSLHMLRRWTPSLCKLTEKQQRGVLGVQRRRSHRLAAAGAAPAKSKSLLVHASSTAPGSGPGGTASLPAPGLALVLASPEPEPAAAALFAWSRRTMARRRADRVLLRVTAAVDRKRTRRQLRCWRDGARRARRAERAVTYSMLVVVGRASWAFYTWRCVARRRSDAQVPRHSLYTTRPRTTRTAASLL